MLKIVRQRAFAARFALACALVMFLAQALASQHLHVQEQPSAAHCAVCVSASGASAPPPSAPAVAVPRTSYVLAQSSTDVEFASATWHSPSAARAPPAGLTIDR